MSMRQIFEIPGYKEILDGLDSLWKRAILRTTSKGPAQSFTNTRNTTDGYSAARILPSAKAFGKAVTKRKQAALWGRYVPAVPDDTTTYPMVLENLLDPSDIQLGRGYRAGSGEPSSNAGFSSTGKTSVEPNSSYSTNFDVGSNGTFGLCFFKSDDTFISGITLSAHFATFTTPSECSYVYITEQENPPAAGKYLYKGNGAVYVPYGYVWKFVKDTVGNTFGYFNETTGEYIAVQGATGTLIQPISGTSETPAPTENDILVSWEE